MSHVHTEDRESYRAAIDHTHDTGEPLDMVTRIVRPDGSIRHVHRRAAIQSDNNGKPLRVYGTVQDITGRIKSEKKKKKHEMLMRATEKVARTGSYEAHLPTSIIYFSEGLFRLFGEEPFSFTPSVEWLNSRSHPDDVPVIREILDHATAGKEGYRYTRRIFHRDGSTRILEANGNVLADADGNAVKVIGLVQDITERKKGEEELLRLKDELAQKAQDKYSKIINSMDEGYCLLQIFLDDDNQCTDYLHLDTNPVFEQQSGMKNVVGKRINELLPDLEPRWKEIYGKVALTGEAIRAEDYVVPLDKWFDIYAFRIDDPKERHVAVIFKDVTERKAEEEQQTFFLKLSDVLRPMSDPSEIQNTAMKILSNYMNVNRAYYAEVLEDSDTTLAGPGYTKDVPPLPRFLRISDFDPKIRQSYLAGETVVLSNIPENPDHNDQMKAAFEKMQIQACIGVPLVKKEKLVAVLGLHQAHPREWTSREIKLVEEVCERTWAAVERARSEAALRQSQERLQKVLTIDTVGVLFIDMQGRFLDANNAFMQMIGYTREEFDRGEMKPEDVILPKWMPRNREAFRELEKTGRFTPYEKELIRPDGTRWWGLFAGMRLSQNECVEFVIDVTETKQTEQALMKAKEKAEAATMAKEDFVSTMSHEIRTPLNAVIGLTNLLLERKPREDQKENLNSLSFSAKNLLTLINDILDFSKLEAGKMELAENEFDLSALLLSLKQAHQPQAQAKETVLQLHLDENVPRRIATDQLKLSQILHNLVGNAVKFTTDGEVNVRVKLHEQDEEQLWLDFIIEDSGIGIAAANMEHIFDKFAQAESSTVRNYGGTGLGLSITKLLLDIMGSEIKAESRINQGSRFYFRLPVKIAGQEIPAEKVHEVKPAQKDLRNYRVLLVEDVEINRKILIQFLQNWWELLPDEAINGKQSVEMAKTNNYDLILMDLRMPVMDGYEATRQIRKLPGYQNIPIMALTADRSQEVQHLRQITGFSDLLTKPFDPNELKQRILQHLSVPEENVLETEIPDNDPAPAIESDGDSFSESVEPAFNLSRYTKIAGTNKEVMEKLVDNSIRAFETYKKEFTAAMQAEEKENLLSDLVHKNTTSVHYIQANHLARKIEMYRELLQNISVHGDELRIKENSIIEEFDEIINGLKSTS